MNTWIGMYWVAESGDVLVQDGPETRSETVPCRRVSSGAYVGTRKLSKLRPATRIDLDRVRGLASPSAKSRRRAALARDRRDRARARR